MRFLAAVCGGWVALRVVMLWPQIDSAESLVRAVLPVAAAHSAAQTASGPVLLPVIGHHRLLFARKFFAATEAEPPHRKADPERVALALLGLTRFGAPRYYPDKPGLVAGLPSATVPPPGSRPGGLWSAARWSGSTWLVARGPGVASPGLLGGQLGGAQAGIRLAYALDRRVALAVRVSSPLRGAGREIAAGLEWRPTRLPVRIVAEQRFVVDGGRGGAVIGVVGGFGPQPVAHGIRVEGYGQAGAIARGRGEALVDGALRFDRPAFQLGAARFDLGFGAWGGAQKGAARLDLGPSIGVRLPIGGTAARLSLDWRQRVAGQARPGSGLVVTLGTDF